MSQELLSIPRQSFSAVNGGSVHQCNEITYSRAFPKSDLIWFDTAAQSPLPFVAVEAAMRALNWEARPDTMPLDADVVVPRRLKEAISALIGAQRDEIVLGNSATYGLNLLAQSLKLKEGDEVVLVHGDFPSTILPWLPLVQSGVSVRLISPSDQHLSVDDVRGALSPRTKVFAASWVNSFTGAVMDMNAIGEVCRKSSVTFILNASQAVGALPIDVSQAPVDAVVSCGQKWLCGPNGTGFCWVSGALRDRLQLVQIYYKTAQAANGATSMRDYRVADGRGGAGMDVFGYGHFMSFGALAAAVELLTSIGPNIIANYNRDLVERILDGLDRKRFGLIGPKQTGSRSALVLLKVLDGSTEHVCAALAGAKVKFSLREGNIRLSPHFFNTASEVDAVLAVLNGHRS